MCRARVGCFWIRSRQGAPLDEGLMLYATAQLAIADFESGVYGGLIELPDDASEALSDSSGEIDDGTGDYVPWYCRDMHTKAGKAARADVCKRMGLSWWFVNCMWFTWDGAAVNQMSTHSFWWQLACDICWEYFDMTEAEAYAKWEDVRHELKLILSQP